MIDILAKIVDLIGNPVRILLVTFCISGAMLLGFRYLANDLSEVSWLRAYALLGLMCSAAGLSMYGILTLVTTIKSHRAARRAQQEKIAQESAEQAQADKRAIENLDALTPSVKQALIEIYQKHGDKSFSVDYPQKIKLFEAGILYKKPGNEWTSIFSIRPAVCEYLKKHQASTSKSSA